MTKRIFPRRRHGGRRHKRVRIYDTQALMELFETDDEEIIKEELRKAWDSVARERWPNVNSVAVP